MADDRSDAAQSDPQRDAAQSSDTLAARYGRTRAHRTRDRLLLVAGAVAVALVLAAWVVWAGLDGQAPSVQATDTGHVLMNEQRAVEVSWTLSVPPGNATACIVQAFDDDFTVVGWRVVEIPASDRNLRTLTERVRVAREANTGLISRCWLT